MKTYIAGLLVQNYYIAAVESSKNLITSENILFGDTSELNLVFNSKFLQQALSRSDYLIEDSQIEFWNIDLATEGKQSTKLTDNITFDSYSLAWFSKKI